jgi:hypothetical protein
MRPLLGLIPDVIGATLVTLSSSTANDTAAADRERALRVDLTGSPSRRRMGAICARRTAGVGAKPTAGVGRDPMGCG